MKYLLLLSAILAALSSYGQKIKGTVVDKTTNLPVSGAMISWGNSKTYTNTAGVFEITAPTLNDSLKIIHFTYKTYTATVSKAISTLHIELEPAVILLNQVTVHGEKNFKKDSVNNRIVYAKQFNYKGPTVMDAFTGNPNKQPGELISINPLLLIAALTKKSTPEYKFNKTLIRDEQADYVDRKFNGNIAALVTDLKGDTLKEFLLRYRPTYQFAQKTTDYDMKVYIKESFEKFKTGGFKGDNLFKK
jgi:hypothetical protein